jgi:putative membrane protein
VQFVDVLPPLNASLNGASAICIFLAWRAIRANQPERHKQLMLTAVGFSVLFLASYLTRAALTGTHRYPADDWTKVAYLLVLGTHTVLAASVPFLVARSIFLALKHRLPEHRRLVRFTLPIWGYVSVTGVLIYFMLYQIGPRRPAAQLLDDCGGSLAGVWHDGADRFDIRDDGAHVTVFPMWDTSRPDDGDKLATILSPWRIELTRAGTLLVGTLSYRITQAGKTCEVSQPARIGECSGRRATLALATAAAVDPATCALAAAPVRREFHLQR